jgi:UDP-N-acetylmuramoyl-tripeptide--D-alanyl-D-alanine ligase
VFEVGMSARGEIARLCEVLRPTHGIVTGVGMAHTQFLGSVENVFLAKNELVVALPRDGALYVNAECPFHQRMQAAFPGRVRRVSLRDAFADLFLDVTAVDLAGVRGSLSILGEGEPRPLWMPIPGRHMAYPALFAVAVAGDLGLDVAKAILTVAGCRPAPHRMSVVARGGLTILDDCYNANPPSTEALLGFVRRLDHPGRKVLVLGDMLELGELAVESHRRIAELAVSTRVFGPIHLVGPIYREAASGAKGVEDAIASGRVWLHDSRDGAMAALGGQLVDGDLLALKASRGIGLDVLVDAL